MQKIIKSITLVTLFNLAVFMCGCTVLPLEERIIKEGEKQKERLAEEQETYEELKSRIHVVCTPIVIPNYRNYHLNVASIKLAAACKRASKAMIRYISDREKEDNIRNVITKVFMDPGNYIEICPGKVGEFPRADGTVQKMSPADFALHLRKVKEKISAAATEVMVNEQKKSHHNSLILKLSVLELWQMEMAKDYMDFAQIMTLEERALYRKELQDYGLWDDIIAGDRSVRKLTERNKKMYFRDVILAADTAVSVSAAVLIEIERFRRICESRHGRKSGWEKAAAIAAEALRVAPYVLKAKEQACYAGKILSFMIDEWRLNWYDVENDLMSH